MFPSTLKDKYVNNCLQDPEAEDIKFNVRPQRERVHRARIRLSKVSTCDLLPPRIFSS